MSPTPFVQSMPNQILAPDVQSRYRAFGAGIPSVRPSLSRPCVLTFVADVERSVPVSRPSVRLSAARVF